MSYTTIDDPSAHFQTAIWTGDGSTSDRNITNDGNSDLAPDFIWGACRTDVQHKHLTDSSRGFSTGNKELVSNFTYPEGDTGGVNTGAYGWLGPSLTDGFESSYGSVNNGYWNVNARTYVAWQWKAAGGTTSSNSDGQITSTVQANTTAGFSIITYTGQSAQKTVGHGLGVKPDMLIFKNRESSSNWYIFHKDLTNYTTYALLLNGVDTQGIYSNAMAGTEPTSTVFTVGNDTVTGNGDDHICYAFASIQGYSKIGAYAGSEQANGPFVYLGFKPAFIMIKNATVISNWRMFDNKRIGYNVANYKLLPNSASQETTDVQIDMLSNGFKIRTTDSEINSGVTHIYMAFAENPFVTSTKIPTTAR